MNREHQVALGLLRHVFDGNSSQEVTNIQLKSDLICIKKNLMPGRNLFFLHLFLNLAYTWIICLIPLGMQINSTKLVSKAHLTNRTREPWRMTLQLRC